MSTDEPRPRIRTSDAEREQVAEILRTAVSDGRLNLEEGDERLAALYTTKFRDELAPLTEDLPGGGSGLTGRDPQGNRPGFTGPPWAQSAGQWGGPGYDRWAYHRWTPFRGLRFVLFMALLIAILTAGPGHFFWPIIPIAFLALGLLRMGAYHLYRRRHRR